MHRTKKLIASQEGNELRVTEQVLGQMGAPMTRIIRVWKWASSSAHAHKECVLDGLHINAPTYGFSTLKRFN